MIRHREVGTGLLVAGALALCVACSGVEPERVAEARGAPAAPASAACTASGPAGAGNFRRAVTVGGETREYLLHVPPGYQPTRTSPLVLNLHGGGGTAEIQAGLSRFDALSDAHGFLLVYPEGTRALVGRGRYWNAGECCGRAERQEVDDVAFLATVIDDVSRDYCVDPRRVFATGMSNGGMMAYRLACDLAGRIAAVASVAGMLVAERCAPSRPIPVLHIHGEADEVVRTEGGDYLGTRFAPLSQTIDFFVAHNRCSPSPAEATPPGATCRHYGACAANAEVRSCLVEGGGHTWPGGRPRVLGGATSAAFDAGEAIWRFFVSHPMPPP